MDPGNGEITGRTGREHYFEEKRLELYLVTERRAAYPFRAFWNGKNFTDGWHKLDVTAWMPLPEPYKEPAAAGHKI